jgi:hypothetical protein
MTYWQYVLSDGVTPSTRSGNISPEFRPDGVDANDTPAFFVGSTNGWFRLVEDLPPVFPSDELLERVEVRQTQGPSLAQGGAAAPGSFPRTYLGEPDPNDQTRWVRGNRIVPQDINVARNRVREKLTIESGNFEQSGVPAAVNGGPDVRLPLDPEVLFDLLVAHVIREIGITEDLPGADAPLEIEVNGVDVTLNRRRNAVALFRAGRLRFKEKGYIRNKRREVEAATELQSLRALSDGIDFDSIREEGE